MPLLSVLINGVPSKPFNPSRGIRQGDPLSTFLFILMSKGLGRMLSNARATRSLKGLSLHDHTPLTHQQFVDDNLLMGNPSIQEAISINETLETFSKSSGITINKDKSQIYFFNTHVITQRNISRILGFTISTFPSKYLGDPLISFALKKYS